MQTDIDSPWFEQDDPEMVELTVGIDGGGLYTHEVPVPFLEQKFSTDESRRQFIEEQLQEMAQSVSIAWRDGYRLDEPAGE